MSTVIIGAGPTGLTLALYLSRNEPVVLIDSEPAVGGCHRVLRFGADAFFTEHGPRVYSAAFLNMRRLMRDEFDLEFTEEFVPYYHSTFLIARELLHIMTWRELFAFIRAYFSMSWESYERFSLAEFSTMHQFRKKTRDALDRLCRAMDGGHLENFSTAHFLRTFDQTAAYSFYQPSRPFDRLKLFQRWKKKLRQQNVELRLGERVISVADHVVLTSAGRINAAKIIFATPLPTLARHTIQGLSDYFAPEFFELGRKSEYVPYICLTLHYKARPDMKRVWGVTLNTAWGIMFIDMGDYWPNKGLYVISLGISRADSPSEYTGKTAHETESIDQLKAEAFRQLNQARVTPTPYAIVLAPNTIRKNGRWESRDTGFTPTVAGYWNRFQSEYDPTVFSVGTHCGFSPFSPNSFESAVCNAMEYCRTVEKMASVPRPLHTNSFFRILLLWSVAIGASIFYALKKYRGIGA